MFPCLEWSLAPDQMGEVNIRVHRIVFGLPAEVYIEEPDIGLFFQF